ncbi:unnamed protein product, partial [Rotaria sp. Silwood1]
VYPILETSGQVSFGTK